MTSDLAKLMEYIDMLQSEEVPEPIEEIVEENKVHPLLQAMQELREEGIVESVDPGTIFNQVKDIHREFSDIEEGDLPDRIYWFDEYKKSELPLSKINLDEFYVDEDLVEDYIEYIKDSPKTMPPIVYDPIAGSVIDGMHRANAYARLGYETIPAYVGLTKSSSYGEREPDNIDETVEEPVIEASPDTLEGSFTPDLVESKTWLAKLLAKGLKGKNAGTIYVLGSWYGNMGIFLQQAGVNFKKLVLVEPDEEKLMRSKDLLQQLNDDGKLILIHQNAEDIVYEKPCVVINTSCNETGPVFLAKLPDNVLCCLQARNNVDNVLLDTDSLEEFVEYFPLNKTYYTGEKELADPETEYTRYMIIGRSGKKLNESATDNKQRMSSEQTLDYLRSIMGTVIDRDDYDHWRNRVLDHDHFDFKTIPTNSIYNELPGLEKDKIEKYKKMDFSKAPPVVVDSDGYLIDGYHRVNTARALGVPTVKAWVGVKQTNETVSTGLGGGSAGNNGGSMVGGPTTYEQEYGMVKSRGQRRIMTMTEDTTTLSDIYDNNYPDHNELIWNYIGTSDLDTPFMIQTINPNKLNLCLLSLIHI